MSFRRGGTWTHHASGRRLYAMLARFDGREIRAVVLEVGGVLLSPGPARLRDAVSRYGLNPTDGDFDACYYISEIVPEEVSDVGLSWRERMCHYAARIGAEREIISVRSQRRFLRVDARRACGFVLLWAPEKGWRS